MPESPSRQALSDGDAAYPSNPEGHGDAAYPSNPEGHGDAANGP
jgi:hypothetical protein